MCLHPQGSQGLLGGKLNCHPSITSDRVPQAPHIYLVRSEVPRGLAWVYVWDVLDVWDVDDVFLVAVMFLKLKKGNWLMPSYDSRD